MDTRLGIRLNGLRFFKGKDYVSHVLQCLAGMDAWTISGSASKELNILVASSASSTQSVVSGRHFLYGRSVFSRAEKLDLN